MPRVIEKTVGVIVLILGAPVLLLIFGFSMEGLDVEPEFGMKWWVEILRRMFRPPEPGTLTCALVAAMSLAVYGCLRRGRARLTVRRAMAWTAILGLLIGLLTWMSRQEQVIVVERTMEHGRLIETHTYANMYGVTRQVVVRGFRE